MGWPLFGWQKLISLGLIGIFPVCVSAQESSAAILRTNGQDTYVNGKPIPASIAIFTDDLIETQKKSVARIDIAGSTAEISPDSMVQFEGDVLVLDHGSVSVNTSRGLRVRVGCLTVIPVNTTAWTHYDVSDTNGTMNVSALQSDVYINERKKNFEDTRPTDSSGRSIVRQGENKKREDKCGAGYIPPSQPVQGIGPILNSPWAKWSAGAIVGGITCYAVCRGDNPVSNSKP